MADSEDLAARARFSASVPARHEAFPLKGCGALDWGMQIAVSMEDAARINASAVAVQVFIGGEFETQSVRNMTRLVDAGQRYGIPVLAVTAVGKELTRDARYLRLATRICAELGAHVVKTYYCEK
jgi:3-hydroxy-5-phosphonooxypentane-2,4-dione thiolase